MVYMHELQWHGFAIWAIRHVSYCNTKLSTTRGKPQYSNSGIILQSINEDVELYLQ